MIVLAKRTPRRRILQARGNETFIVGRMAIWQGVASPGLDQNLLVSGLFLATIMEDRIDRVIGKLTGALMQKTSACLKRAMDLP